jgi:hypothetical protein
LRGNWILGCPALAGVQNVGDLLADLDPTHPVGRLIEKAHDVIARSFGCDLRFH